MVAIRVCLALLASAAIVYGDDKFSCWVGTVSATLPAMVNPNPAQADPSANVTVQSGCDACTLSVQMTGQTTFVNWMCTNMGGNPSGCMTSITTTKSSVANTFTCQCCGDKCNEDPTCKLNCALDPTPPSGLPAPAKKVACYNGSSTNMGSERFDADPTHAPATDNVVIVPECDFCSITVSSTTYPMGYSAVSWRCETSASPAGSMYMKATNKQMTQISCSCTDDKCNSDAGCKVAPVCPGDGWITPVTTSGEITTTPAPQKVSCYVGSVVDMKSMAFDTNPLNYKADANITVTPTAECDYCQIIASGSSFGSMMSSSVTWSCGKNAMTSSPFGCMKSFMYGDASNMKQFSCQCCEDKCNADGNCRAKPSC